MAKDSELQESYAKENQHIRGAIKTLVDADAGLIQLHWAEILPLMRKFGKDIALMHHISFRDLVAPTEDLEQMLMSFNRGISSLGQIMSLPDAPRLQEYGERTVEMPPHFALFMGSKQPTPHRPMHFQNLRPQVPAPQTSTPAPQVNITFPKRKLPPRRIKRSLSQMQCLASCVSPLIAASKTSLGSQHRLDTVPVSSQSPTMPTSSDAETAAYLSTSESKGISSPRRRREPDACSVCKLKKTGCGGRFKHCLKNPANIRSPTATLITKKRPHLQVNRKAARFPANGMTRPALNGELSQRFPPSGQRLAAAEDFYSTGLEENAPLDRSDPLVIGAAFDLQYAHTFPTTSPADMQDGTNIFATPAHFSTEWFDGVGYHTDYALD